MGTIEATQFSVSEYQESLKANTVHKNQFKNKGMEMLKQLVLDPKSELNTRLGGLDNVQRVRVMKDKEDETKLSLTFNLKSPEKELQRRQHEQDRKKEAEALKAFPLFIPDVRGLVVEALRSAAQIQDEHGFVFPVHINEIVTTALDVWGDEVGLKDVRQKVTDIVMLCRENPVFGEKKLLAHYLNFALSLLNVYIVEYIRSSRDLLELAATLFRVRGQVAIDTKHPPRKQRKPRPQPTKVEKKETSPRS